MAVFVATVGACKTIGVSIVYDYLTNIFCADNLDEAQRHANRMHLELRPESEGWSQHNARLIEVSAEQLDELRLEARPQSEITEL
jgi:hypothetical protein